MRTQDLREIELPAPSPIRGWRRTVFATTVSVAVHLSAGLALYDWTPRLRPPLSDRQIRVALVSAPAPVVSQTRRAPSPPPAKPVKQLEPAAKPLTPERAVSRVAPKPEMIKPATKRSAVPQAAPEPSMPADQQMAKTLVPRLEALDTVSSTPADPQPAFTAPSLAGLSNPKPPYPLLARRRGLEGQVLLSVQVQADGRVAGVEVIQSSGHVILDRAAVKTLYRWRFTPARQGDQPVSARVEVPIRFQLRDAS